jgi:hypothetical protein
MRIRAHRSRHVIGWSVAMCSGAGLQ